MSAPRAKRTRYTLPTPGYGVAAAPTANFLFVSDSEEDDDDSDDEPATQKPAEAMGAVVADLQQLDR